MSKKISEELYLFCSAQNVEIENFYVFPNSTTKIRSLEFAKSNNDKTYRGLIMGEQFCRKETGGAWARVVVALSHKATLLDTTTALIREGINDHRASFLLSKGFKTTARNSATSSLESAAGQTRKLEKAQTIPGFADMSPEAQSAIVAFMGRVK